MTLRLMSFASTAVIKMLAKEIAIFVPIQRYRVLEDSFFPLKWREFSLRSKPKHIYEVECRYGGFV